MAKLISRRRHDNKCEERQVRIALIMRRLMVGIVIGNAGKINLLVVRLKIIWGALVIPITGAT